MTHIIAVDFACNASDKTLSSIEGKTVRLICFLASAPCLALVATHGRADDYPSKPIRFIAGSAPGGATDIMARTIGQKLAENLGRQVIIDNRPGAGQNISYEITAKAPPDGYTICIGASPLAINPAIYRNLPFNVLRDFTPVGLLAYGPNILVVQPSTGAKSVKDLIGLARAAPGKLSYGSAGFGVASHLAGEVFNFLARVKIIHVPYKGQGLVMTDLLGGQIQIAFPTIPSAIQFVKAGKLTALGIATLRRSPSMPELPTIDEAGVKGYDVSGWFGVIGPARMPKSVVAKQNQEINRILQDPQMRETLSRIGLDSMSSTPGEFSTIIASDTAKWAKLVKEVGIKLE